MTRILAFAIISLLAFAPEAQAMTQLQRSVAQYLREYGFRGVDVTELSLAQLATIQHIATQKGREGQKRGLIRSALGGGYSLRGLLR